MICCSLTFDKYTVYIYFTLYIYFFNILRFCPLRLETVFFLFLWRLFFPFFILSQRYAVYNFFLFFLYKRKKEMMDGDWTAEALPHISAVIVDLYLKNKDGRERERDSHAQCTSALFK